MGRFKRLRQMLTPVRLLVAGYALVVLVVAALLCLPFASATGKCQSFPDALFMASSGVSTTGLTTVDVGTSYSLFGQIVLLLDFQIGGIGYMTVFVYMMYLLGAQLPLRHQLVAMESMPGPNFSDLARFFRWVVVMTLFFEIIGAAVLTCCWAREFSVGRAAYLGVYHSVSAFCTAGFSLFPDSLMSYQRDPVVNVTIALLCLVGGIGFIVLADIRDWRKRARRREYPRGLSVHSKLALGVTAIVILLGTGVVFAAEKWPASWTVGERAMASSFQAISASTTAGYNTVEIGGMSPNSLFALMLLMFIGASPGGTGGGVKTTTVGVLWASVWCQFRRKDANLFRRRISEETVNKAYAIFLSSILIVVLDTMLLTAMQGGSPLQNLFEVVSALGNAGLSTGITPSLTPLAKVLLSVTMFIGRVGPLAIVMALMAKPKPAPYHYAGAAVFVG